MRRNLTAEVVGAGLCLMIAGIAQATVSNVYWRVDLVQGTSIIAEGRGSTQEAAWLDCYRLQEHVRAMTAAETRRSDVAAVTRGTVRWCKNPARYATVSPDPVAPTPVNCVVSAWSAWSDPPWLECVDGMQSRSVVRTRTIVTQPANGGTACPMLVETQSQTRVCPGVAVLSWTPPTQNTDGTWLTNLAGYRISYGTSSAAMTSTVQISNPSVTNYSISNLPPGTYYFAVRAYTSNGTESDASNVATKIVS